MVCYSYLLGELIEEKMTSPDEFGRLSAVFLPILISFTFQGAHCQLVVSPAGPTLVNAFAGSNVTLAVTFGGATDPTVTWFMAVLPVVTWTINSGAPPDIDESRRKVLRIEANGSLSFVNVPLGYASNYTIEMVKSGLGRSVTTFTLKVFDVTLSTPSGSAQEGTDRFTLQYSMLQGVGERQMWFFSGLEIKSNSHYSVEERSLVILNPNRNDTGRYTVLLTNPFSSVTTDINITVLYGPDEPILEARPARPFYVTGDSLSISCQADGFPPPTAEWVFGSRTLVSLKGVLNLTHVQTSQGGNYTCTLINGETRKKRQQISILNIYERPPGDPMCSLESVNNVDLQYHCWWSGGTPQAMLSFPALSNTSRGAGNLSLTFTAANDLDGKTVTCMAEQPVEQNNCSITAGSPRMFLPAVGTTVDSTGKIVVTIHCVSEASPQAVVSWSKGSEAVPSMPPYQISKDTTQLEIRDYNVSNFLLQIYTCTCRNPLGSQRREIQLREPSISDSSLFTNPNGTIVTLTWEVPPTSIVTGFDIQMKGPDSLSRNHNGTQTGGSSNGFHTILPKPGHSRSADIFNLDPELTYKFRVIPKARMTEGRPSEVHRIGPGDGLSGSAIAGIAAGIPCGLLLLVLLGGLIYFCVYFNKNKSRPTRYPVSRAVEKAVTTPTETTPHNLLTGGLQSPPDYNRTPSERSVALPAFLPPPPVRVATTV